MCNIMKTKTKNDSSYKPLTIYNNIKIAKPKIAVLTSLLLLSLLAALSSYAKTWFQSSSHSFTEIDFQAKQII